MKRWLGMLGSLANLQTHPKFSHQLRLLVKRVHHRRHRPVFRSQPFDNPKVTMSLSPTYRAPRSPAAANFTWKRDFPAVPEQAGEARRFLGGILDGSPAAADAVLCLSELAANACLHSRSRESGGSFTVRAHLNGSALRVEVTDAGGPWTWSDYPDEQHGRGLLIVAQLALGWGRTGDAASGWTVWYEMACPLSQQARRLFGPYPLRWTPGLAARFVGRARNGLGTDPPR
ncbi:MAG: ATP-binding protein [Trebonia sp.]